MIVLENKMSLLFDVLLITTKQFAENLLPRLRASFLLVIRSPFLSLDTGMYFFRFSFSTSPSLQTPSFGSVCFLYGSGLYLDALRIEFILHREGLVAFLVSPSRCPLRHLQSNDYIIF